MTGNEPDWGEAGPVLAIFHDGEAWPFAKLAGSRLGGRWARYLQWRRNPRTLAQMEALARAHCGPALAGEVRVLQPGAYLPQPGDERFRTVLLLWPDANGTGWGRIERSLQRQWPAGQRLWVINGRGRCFALDRSLRRRFRRRRWLESSLAGEAVFMLGMLAATPALLVWDWIHGRT